MLLFLYVWLLKSQRITLQLKSVISLADHNGDFIYHTHTHTYTDTVTHAHTQLVYAVVNANVLAFLSMFLN